MLTDKDREVMADLAVVVRKLKADILARFPGALFDVDCCNGCTWLEVDYGSRTDDNSLTVLIKPDHYGLYTRPGEETGYGERPDETFQTVELLFNRLVELLEAK